MGLFFLYVGGIEYVEIEGGCWNIGVSMFLGSMLCLYIM